MESPQEWDARYREHEHIWSGRPNESIVAEASTLTAGRAVDVGCGEGADSVWLAGQGWRVTGVDPSSVAIERARSAASVATLDIDWIHAGLESADLPLGSFDLVLSAFPALMVANDPLTRLCGLVAPGGYLLLLFHAGVDADWARERGFDLADRLGPEAFRTSLPPDFAVIVDEERNREPVPGAGAHHTRDVVQLARRTPPGT
jgi:SAM-dependent methyltransferase